MSYTLPSSVTTLLAGIDAGQVTPLEAEAAIRQAGGPDFVQLALIRKWLDAAGGSFATLTGAPNDNAALLASELGKVGIKGADIASNGTGSDIGASLGAVLDITGTTTITAFPTATAGVLRLVRFTGILILTYNGTSLQLPSAANITTAAGDTALFESLGSGNWKCVMYQRADGTALVAGIVANHQTASYALIASDNGKLISMDVGSGNALTLPLNATTALPIGFQCVVEMTGAGITTITPESGSVTLHNVDSKYAIKGQYGLATVIKRDTNVWTVSGALT